MRMGTTIVRMALRCKILCCLLQRRSVQRFFFVRNWVIIIFVLNSHGPAMGDGYQSLLEIPGMHVFIYMQKMHIHQSTLIGMSHDSLASSYTKRKQRKCDLFTIAHLFQRVLCPTAHDRSLCYKVTTKPCLGGSALRPPIHSEKQHIKEQIEENMISFSQHYKYKSF